MTMDARHEVTAYTSRRRRKKRWRSAVLALAAVVMYQLVLRVEKILNRTWGVQS